MTKSNLTRLALMLLIAASGAQAAQIMCTAADLAGIAPFQTSQITTNASACSASVQNHRTDNATNMVTIPVSATDSVDLFDTFVQTLDTRSFVSGTLGTAHGFVSVGGNNTPGFYSYTSTYQSTDTDGNPVTIHFSLNDPNPMPNSGMSSEVQLEWHDVITLLSPTAPLGSMITFNISSPLHASFSGSGCPIGGIAKNYFEVDYAQTVNGITFGGTNIGAAIDQHSGCDPTQTFAGGATLQAPVGSALYLYGFFKIRVDAVADPNGVIGIIDASNTGHSYLDILTPNAYYVDENGVINGFATPPPDASTPEPGSIGLLGLGLVSLSLVLKKKRPAQA